MIQDGAVLDIAQTQERLSAKKKPLRNPQGL